MNGGGFHLDRNLVLSVHCMEVRDPVLSVKHADHNPEEA